MKYLQNFSVMSNEELEHTTVGCGMVDLERLRQAVFGADSDNQFDICKLRVALADLSETKSELLEIEFGYTTATAAEFDSVNNYIFKTPLDKLESDLENTLRQLRKCAAKAS